MSNETPPPGFEAPETAAADEAAEIAAEEMSPEAAMASEILRLEAENTELRDRMLRIAAEMDNLRKRAEKEIADSRSYSIAGFARDMLTATDSLERALVALPAEARENADQAMTSLIEGIEMTEREMQRLLGKHGIVPIEAEGVKFDPHRHQAMFDVPDPSVPEGTVVQVMQSGYAIGDRVLRPAMVGIAKGGPKPGAPGPADETDASGQAGGGTRIDREV
jgi:molecular chaperone GrpE